MARVTATKRNKLLTSAAAVAGFIGLSAQSQAQAQSQAGQVEDYVDASSIDGVRAARQLSDGSVELTLDNGQVVRIAAADVRVEGGRILIAESAVEQAGLGEDGAFIDTNLLLLGGGLLAAGLGGAAGAGVFGDDDLDNRPTGGNDTLVGTNAGELIDGLAGNDTIDGQGGDDTLIGNAGSDTLIGGSGDDTLVADLDDTALDGGSEGETSGDTIDFSGESQGINIDLDTNFSGVSNPGLSQEGAVEAFDGTNAIEAGIIVTDVENVIGTEFNDRIFGNAEDNILQGLGGDDVFHAFAGADTVDGGEGVDTVLFVQAGGGVTADLEAGTAGTNTLISIENFTGGAFDDTVSGSSVANVLNGNGGNDTLDGRGGADTLIGGEGSDTLIGDVEDASFDGGADVAGEGGFTLVNAAAAGVSLDAGGNVADLDAVLTAALNGEIYFNAHSTDFPAGENRGQLVLLQDNRDANGEGTVVFGARLDGDQEVQDPPVETDATGQGQVTFTTDANGVVTGYEVSVTVRGVTLNELTVFHLHEAPAGSNGPVVVDLLRDAGIDPATDIADRDFAGTGFTANDLGDQLDLNGASEGVFVDLDTEFSGAPNPGLSQAGSVQNIGVVGGGAETFNIAAFDLENVVGTELADRLFGNAEDNVLEGRGGDDTFHAFAGNDVYDGGEGTDTALFVQAAGGIIADLEAGVAVAGDDVNELISIENLAGGVGDDLISGTAGANVLTGNGGADALIGRGGDDTLVADELDTTLDGGEGSDTLDLSNLSEGVNVDLDVNTAGNATPGATPTQEGRLTVGSNADQTLTDIENIIGTAFDDVLFGNSENNVISAGAGDDRVHGFGGADALDGGEGTDTILLNQAGAGVTIDLANGTVGASTITNFENANGGAFNDTLIGSDGANELIGGGGDDTLAGGAGTDVLTGGAGADGFAFDQAGVDDGAQEDSITDFDFDNDSYQLDAGSFGVTGSVVFESLDANAAGASIDPASNVIVLTNGDDDNDAGTVFNARSAATQIAGLGGEGAGFFVYFNSALNVNRLVFSEDLGDANAALSIISRQTDLTGQDAIDALADFSAGNFAFTSGVAATSGKAEFNLADLNSNDTGFADLSDVDDAPAFADEAGGVFGEPSGSVSGPGGALNTEGAAVQAFEFDIA